MKVLILGSEGFIGRHLARHFLDAGYSVTGCDLYDAPTQRYKYVKISRLSPEWEELIAGSAFDSCINAAGSGHVPYSISHPFSDFESNSLDTIRVLDCIRRNQPSCKYIHLSSAAVYGNPERLPIAEEDRQHPLSPYGWHKLISEQICKEFTEVYKISTAIVRPFSVYGPGLKKQLFWDIYQKYLTTGPSISLWGTGKESRDFIYIEDLAAALHKILLKSPMQAEVYNIATGSETYIEKAVNTFLSHFPGDPKAVFNQQTRAGDPVNWRASVSRIEALGFKPAVPLETGLEKTARWLQTLNTKQ